MKGITTETPSAQVLSSIRIKGDRGARKIPKSLLSYDLIPPDYACK